LFCNRWYFFATSYTVNEMGFTCGTYIGEEKCDQSLARRPEG
jgi:hypothetical protein